MKSDKSNLTEGDCTVFPILGLLYFLGTDPVLGVWWYSPTILWGFIAVSIIVIWARWWDL